MAKKIDSKNPVRVGASVFLGEVEPYPGPVAINADHVLDVTEWGHALPREMK